MAIFIDLGLVDSPLNSATLSFSSEVTLEQNYHVHRIVVHRVLGFSMTSNISNTCESSSSGHMSFDWSSGL